MLGRERRAVQLVGQENLLAQRFLEWQAALEGLFLPALDAAVEPGEEHLDRAVGHAGLLQQRAQRRASPASGADCLEQPRLADGPRFQTGAAVAGALHRRGHLHRGPFA